MQTFQGTFQAIDPEMQKRLNEPLRNPHGLTKEDEAFLRSIVSRIEASQINLYVPSSLYNETVYEKLPPEEKARVEIQAFSTLASIREIYGLFKAYPEPTFQLENLVHKVRLVKEQFESSKGDVFIV